VEEDYFLAGLKSVGISHFFYYKGELRTRLTSPLTRDEALLGVLVIRTTLDDLIDSLAQREGLGKTGETLLARRLPNGDAQFITPLRFDPNAALRRTIPAMKTEVPITQALLKNATQLDSAPDYRGVPVIAITEYLEKTDWGMVSKIDRSEAFAPMERATVSLISALLLTGGCVFLLAVGAANRLTGPIVDLASTARQVEAESNYSIRAPLLIAGDEIGELTHSFNNMPEAIGERERAIRENEKRLRAILETAVEGIVSIDENGIIESFNEAASDIFGYAKSEVIGKNVNILMPEPYHNEHDGYLRNYRETGVRKIIGSGQEVQGKRKSGATFPIELSISEVELPDRRLFTGFIRDISDRRRSEEEQRRMNRELRRSNEELEQFAYVASHDLKSPLRAIENLASWIDEDSGELLTEDSRNDLNLLRGRVHRMNQLLDALLEYSRIGREEDESRRTSAAEIVEQCVSLHAPPGGFEVQVTTGLPEMIAPPGALLRVFGNLIANAVKHHERKDGCVEISWREVDNTHEFTVRDDGPGIDPRFHGRIFELFQTLKRRDEVEGSGMGLALVKKTVEALGGRIRVESEPGSGASFIFSLPVTAEPASGHIDI